MMAWNKRTIFYKPTHFIYYGLLFLSLVVLSGFTDKKSALNTSLPEMFNFPLQEMVKNRPAIVANLKHMAQKGDANMQWFLGVIYYEGVVVKKDYRTALKWLTMAVKQNHPGAYFHLGAMYDQGHGVKPDHKKAFMLFKKSADQGVLEAQYNVGVMFYYGTGVATNYETAIYWLRVSANKGHVGAQYNLCVMYHNGEGVEKPDNVQAYKWCGLAYEHISDTYGDLTGLNDDISGLLILLEEKMTESQLEEAKRLIEQFYLLKAKGHNI